MVVCIPGEGRGPRLQMVRRSGTRIRSIPRTRSVQFKLDSPASENTPKATPPALGGGAPWIYASGVAGDTSGPSDVLLALDRAAAVLGLRHHPVNRSEGKHTGEDHRSRPAHRYQEPVERLLANVAEGEEEVPHLYGRLNGCEYRRAPERMSGYPAKADGDDENRPPCW